MHILNIIEAISPITLPSYHLNYLYDKKMYLITIRLFLFDDFLDAYELSLLFLIIIQYFYG